MNIIEQWAELCESRFGYSSNDNTWGRGRFGASRPDEFGAKVMQLFSPANFEAMETDEKIKNSDFGCFMTDISGVRRKLGIIKNTDKLGSGLIGLFWCKEGTMTPAEMAEYFNKWCGSVLPREYTGEDFVFVAKEPKLGMRANPEKQKTIYDFYTLNLTTDFDGSDFDKDEMEKKFNDEIKDIYKDSDLDMKIGQKDQFQKYMRSSLSQYENMTPGKFYMGFTAKVGSPVDKDVIRDILEKLTSKKYGDSEIIQLSRPIKKKDSVTDKFEDYNLFISKEK